MPDNQFTAAEKRELLSFKDANNSDSPEVSDALAVLEKGTKDNILILFVKSHCSLIYSIEDQGELLKDNELAHLTEAEQVAAEEDYEREERFQHILAQPTSANYPVTADVTAILQQSGHLPAAATGLFEFPQPISANTSNSGLPQG